MFDPTIYENMKVVIEGAVYDLDLSGNILVTNRSNNVELSTMSRSYSIQFKLLGLGDVLAEVSLAASTEELAAEILEKNTLSTPGCTLQISFLMNVLDLDEDCTAVQHLLFDIWGHSCTLSQKLSFVFGNNQHTPYKNEIILDFGRKFSENVIDDIPSMLEHVILSMERLNELR
jgi:hypothetical protein